MVAERRSARRAAPAAAASAERRRKAPAARGGGKGKGKDKAAEAPARGRAGAARARGNAGVAVGASDLGDVSESDAESDGERNAAVDAAVEQLEFPEGSDSEGDDSDGDEEGSDGVGGAEADEDADDESEGDESDEDDEEDDEDPRVSEAIVDYVVERQRRLAGGGEGEGEGDGDSSDGEGDARSGDESERESDPGTDSSEDEHIDRNRVGGVPMAWYRDEEHIGYDEHGERIKRREGNPDAMDALVARSADPSAWRTLYDEKNDEHIVLSREEIGMIQRIRKGAMPHAEVDPYPEWEDTFHYEGGPLSSAPEPKRRFIPSKWEAQKVVKLVRALRHGWIKNEKKEAEKPRGPYLIWDEGGDEETTRAANGLAYIPAPKAKLPGHEESYNPPDEYLPTEEERAALQLVDDDDRPDYVPQRFGSLRHVPAYGQFIHERFERCLDLYLCHRKRKSRIHMDPKDLLPKLPKPRELRPFPCQSGMVYEGHAAPVSALGADSTGQWLASCDRAGVVRVFEVSTARCVHAWRLATVDAFSDVCTCLAWNPRLPVLAVGVGASVFLLATETGPAEARAEAAELLGAGDGGADEDAGGEKGGLCSWEEGLPEGCSGAADPSSGEGDGSGGGADRYAAIRVRCKHAVSSVAWHFRGDYFVHTAPAGASASVLVHQLSRRSSQNPFRKNKGRVSAACFHPSKPFLFVATQHHVRCYNLLKQSLAKKLMPGSSGVSCMAVHPGGDNLVVGTVDSRVSWFDMDLSTKPYKALRAHSGGVRSVAFHPRLPLLASCADDGAAHVLHGRVFDDLLQSALIVPLRVLRGHATNKGEGVLACAFHPRQPWLFTAGVDNAVSLWVE